MTIAFVLGHGRVGRPFSSEGSARTVTVSAAEGFSMESAKRGSLLGALVVAVGVACQGSGAPGLGPGSAIERTARISAALGSSDGGAPTGQAINTFVVYAANNVTF